MALPLGVRKGIGRMKITLNVNITPKERIKIAKALYEKECKLGVKRLFRVWKQLAGHEQGVYEIFVDTVLEELNKKEQK